jgi:hypothetical protein
VNVVFVFAGVTSNLMFPLAIDEDRVNSEEAENATPY